MLIHCRRFYSRLSDSRSITVLQTVVVESRRALIGAHIPENDKATPLGRGSRSP